MAGWSKKAAHAAGPQETPPVGMPPETVSVPAAEPPPPKKQADAKPDAQGRIKVRALDTGTYPNHDEHGRNYVQAIMRHRGEIFTISCEQHFTKEWMEKVDDESKLEALIDPNAPPDSLPLTTIPNRVKTPPGFANS